MPVTKCAIIFFLVLAVMAVARIGRGAAPNPAFISLQGDELPNIICVAYVTDKPNDEDFIDLRKRNHVPEIFALRGDGEWSLAELDPQDARSIAPSPRLGPTPRKSTAFDLTDDQRALVAFAPRSATECGARSDACIPRLRHTPGQDAMRCAWNGQSPPSGDRVAILSFTSDGLGHVDKVLYQGSGVSVYFVPASPNVPQGTLRVSVAGGHYIPTDDAYPADGRITLYPSLRCHGFDIPLPSAAAADSSYVALRVCPEQARADVKNGSLCSRPWTLSVRVDLPASGRRLLKWISADLFDGKPTAPDGDIACDPNEPPGPLPGSTASFRTSWTDDVPPETVRFRATAVNFRWKVDREYPLPYCPDARLAATGTCFSTHFLLPSSDGCSYRCSVDPRGLEDLAFPAEIAFTAEAVGDEWTESLTRAGDVLSGHPDGEKRHFVVDFTLWDLPRVAETVGDRISTIELGAPSGKVSRLTPEASGHLLQLAGVNSGEVLTYRIYGERDYDEDHVTLVDGHLLIPPPSATAVQFTFGVFGGGGMASTPWVPFSSTSNPPVYDQILPRPLGAVELSIRYKPKQGAWPSRLLSPRAALELRADYLLSTMPYIALRTPDDLASRIASSALYSRYMIALLPMWSLLDTVEVGLTPLGLAAAGPLRGQDASTVGSTQGPIYAALASTRFGLTHSIALELNGRALFGEHMYGYSSQYQMNPLFRGTPFRADYQIATLAFDLGIRAWIF
jgi:hypothetical protein